jgi:hypothetical protein
MSKRITIGLISSVASVIILAGCSLFQPAVATDWPGRSETLTALAPIQPPVSTVAPPSAASSETPTSAPMPTEAPQATNVPPTQKPLPSATQAPCYQAQLVKDVTIPDGKVIAPGKDFVKTWQLWNTGSCNWQPSMLAVFDSGTQLSTNLEYKIGQSVPSGEMVNVSVPMTAPLAAGEYTSNWRLKPAGGVPFGVGAANVPFYAKIKVGDTLFTVTDVSVGVNNNNASAVCPPGYTFQFTAKITTSGAGTVTYRWVFGDTSTADESITFTDAGSKSVSNSWTLSETTTQSAEIYIVQPNRQTFSGVSYSMTCQ